ncbi:hypothetical protein C5167_036908 [Papaver somniferum]|uniref:Secreted protein n=1 Tax=Papaver somniferum TaxID=3469 RepID=A0A4Y7I985_PAPSO|nr:hypothetical protein C5167_036908 [Papaver somniferum]
MKKLVLLQLVVLWAVVGVSDLDRVQRFSCSGDSFDPWQKYKRKLSKVMVVMMTIMTARFMDPRDLLCDRWNNWRISRACVGEQPN